MTMTLIQTVTVGAGGAASIDFTNIPQTYTDLMLVFSTRPGSADTSWVQSLRFNGLTTNLSMRLLDGDGASASSGTNGTRIDPINEGSTATANTFSNGQAYIPNYAGNTNKSVSIDSISETNATTAYQRLAAGLWSSTAAITQVSLIAATTYAQYSTASLYGINRIPTATLGTTPTVDYLVVAGGGGGGSRSGGGGGAGGLRTASAFSVAPGSALTVTVGAGGAGSTNGTTNQPGAAGSNSVFSSITTVGGGAGAGEGGTGGSGGSGGGAGAYGSSTTVGAGTSGQGNNGGLALASSSNGAAGGGGAVSVGGNGTTTVGGNGGAGALSTYSGSNIYYAGGGGGGTQYLGYAGGSGGSGGGGAGGVAATSAGSAGLASTGGGGGGGGASAGVGYAGGSGGSGVVIIRYPDTYNPPATVTGSPSVNYVNGYRVYTWTASGSITF